MLFALQTQYGVTAWALWFQEEVQTLPIELKLSEPLFCCLLKRGIRVNSEDKTRGVCENANSLPCPCPPSSPLCSDVSTCLHVLAPVFCQFLHLGSA